MRRPELQQWKITSRCYHIQSLDDYLVEHAMQSIIWRIRRYIFFADNRGDVWWPLQCAALIERVHSEADAREIDRDQVRQTRRRNFNLRLDRALVADLTPAAPIDSNVDRVDPPSSRNWFPSAAFNRWRRSTTLSSVAQQEKSDRLPIYVRTLNIFKLYFKCLSHYRHTYI